MKTITHSIIHSSNPSTLLGLTALAGMGIWDLGLLVMIFVV